MEFQEILNELEGFHDHYVQYCPIFSAMVIFHKSVSKMGGVHRCHWEK